ncbi:ABC transporter permease subunit [Lentzea sp. HUAS12]|uniref:ABC transporter permease subunit n=1 Tax=Lentzea sp. HUAS12 TaxID=2951806 RepID=UPI00209C9D59|nr:ABC transporter permease subunit [Lentzea sp. HUAS12]USX56186.1 ABC transporter permease subunit [Lentzea sp. HUAS12]
MIWAAFRLQRLQLLTLLGLLVAGSVTVVLLRSNMIDFFTSTRIIECLAPNAGPCPASPEDLEAFAANWGDLFLVGRVVIVLLPVLIGVFIGAPLFAQELEQGTHVLAFTQSVSRTRWMLSKLVVALVPALVVLVVLQYLVWWWLDAAGVLGPHANGSFHVLNFGVEHVSPVGYALFAFALGTFAGAVSRRTLVAMTAGLGVFVAARFALFGLANRWVPRERRDAPVGSGGDLGQDGLWVGSGWLDTAGQQVSPDRAAALIKACKPGTETQEAYTACLQQSGVAGRYVITIPESSAWLAHVYDFAVFGGLAVVLLAGTAWALRRQS